MSQKTKKKRKNKYDDKAVGKVKSFLKFETKKCISMIAFFYFFLNPNSFNSKLTTCLWFSEAIITVLRVLRQENNLV